MKKKDSPLVQWSRYGRLKQLSYRPDMPLKTKSRVHCAAVSSVLLHGREAAEFAYQYLSLRGSWPWTFV